LKSAGCAVDHEIDGRDVARLVTSEPYSLVILDLILPGVSGFEVLREIRRRGCKVPILILTARQAVNDRVQGLDGGADDYLTKPFDLAELEARVRALIRRAEGAPYPRLSCGTLEWERSSGTFLLNSKPLLLRRREAAVLASLMTRAGKVTIKDRLLAEVFGFDDPVAPNTLELYIARLRKKLEPDGPTIRTVRGVGYMLEAR
jgi:DNA-binding response OmpR family regulator